MERSYVVCGILEAWFKSSSRSHRSQFHNSHCSHQLTKVQSRISMQHRESSKPKISINCSFPRFSKDTSQTGLRMGCSKQWWWDFIAPIMLRIPLIWKLGGCLGKWRPGKFKLSLIFLVNVPYWCALGHFRDISRTEWTEIIIGSPGLLPFSRDKTLLFKVGQALSNSRVHRMAGGCTLTLAGCLS